MEFSHIDGVLNGIDTDLVVIGSQECSRSIFWSVFNASKSRWENLIFRYLRDRYYLLESEKLNAMHICVFVNQRMKFYIHSIEKSVYSCGLLKGIIGNKGAVSVSFKIGRDDKIHPIQLVITHKGPIKAIPLLQKKCSTHQERHFAPRALPKRKKGHELF